MTKADEALAAIDAGLQQSSEVDVVQLDPSKCARCQIREPAEDADTCEPCRSFLLGDTDVDPGVAGAREGCGRCVACAMAGELDPDLPEFYRVVLEMFAAAATPTRTVRTPSGGLLIFGAIPDPEPGEFRGLTPTAVWFDEVDDWRPPLVHPDSDAAWVWRMSALGPLRDFGTRFHAYDVHDFAACRLGVGLAASIRPMTDDDDRCPACVAFVAEHPEGRP